MQRKRDHPPARRVGVTFPLCKSTPGGSDALLPTVRRAIPPTLYQGICGFFRWQVFVILGNFAYGKAVAIMAKNDMGKFVSHDAVDPGLRLSFKSRRQVNSAKPVTAVFANRLDSTAKRFVQSKGERK